MASDLRRTHSPHRKTPAHTLALSRNEPLGFAHLAETMDAMEEFTAEFAALGRA